MSVVSNVPETNQTTERVERSEQPSACAKT